MTMQLEMNLQDDAALGSQAEAVYTPAIRFKGFSGNWERYNFSDVSESFEYGLNAAATEYDGENKYIRITDINEKTRALDLNDLTSPNFDLSKAENYKLHLGDLLFARTGASVGKTYIYKKNDGVVYFAGFLIRAKLKNTVSSQFIFQSTLTEKYNKFIRLTSQRSGQPGVNAKEYGLCEIYLSQLEEQTAIGNYFQQLDSLITQHQHKHTKLLNLKQALLQKMFPKQGATVPEVRFKGFSGDWEKKKIGDILAEVKRPIELLDAERYQLVTVKRRNEGVVPRSLLKGSEILVKNYFVIKSGDFLISKRQVVHGANGIVPDQLDNAVVSNEYLVITDSQHITAKFWTAISKKPEMHKLFFVSSYGVDIEKLVFDVSDWAKRTIVIPTVSEQIRITEYLQQLDHLITQQHALLTKLSNLKQAYLAKMFI